MDNSMGMPSIATGNPVKGGGIGAGSWYMAAARRRAISQAMGTGGRVKHGVFHAPTIEHPRNGRGSAPQQFGNEGNGGFKAGGF